MNNVPEKEMQMLMLKYRQAQQQKFTGCDNLEILNNGNMKILFLNDVNVFSVCKWHGTGYLLLLETVLLLIVTTRTDAKQEPNHSSNCFNISACGLFFESFIFPPFITLLFLSTAEYRNGFTGQTLVFLQQQESSFCDLCLEVSSPASALQWWTSPVKIKAVCHCLTALSKSSQSQELRPRSHSLIS